MSPTVLEIELEDLNDIDITLMTLRKPTELKKVIDSVPKPLRAVPKNGLPMWYRMGLECKLPVPTMPAGKILFSRGKIGEDVRRVGLGTGGPQATFDLTDPYCNNVSYDYVSMHDPHLSHHFAQKPTKQRMQSLGLCTKDGRAVCSLKEFNTYRKYLYNQFMDKIHMAMNKLDERARDDLILKRVDGDVARRLQIFIKAERARDHLEKIARENAEELEAKKRAAKEKENKIAARMTYLAEFKKKQRKDRSLKAREKQNRIKQRVEAAVEMEMRRKITMLRQWRTNEKKRLNRLKFERESKKKLLEDQANEKWSDRVNAQNMKLQEEALLLKLYTEDMAAGAARRTKKAEVYAYNTDLELQRLRLANWKALHGGSAKAAKLVKKMGSEFERSKRGAKGMTLQLAQELAVEAMNSSFSTRGDTLMTLGQARAKMDVVTILPSAPIKILDEVLENAIMEFARRRVHLLLLDINRVVRARCACVFFKDYRPELTRKSFSKPSRWSGKMAEDVSQKLTELHGSGSPIAFGPIIDIPVPETAAQEDDTQWKSVRNRPPTPVPSMTKLAEVTFIDRVEDLPDPVTHGLYLPERRKLLEMINAAAKLLTRTVTQRVEKGMDLNTSKVTLPKRRHAMEWGETVESMANAVVNHNIRQDSTDVRHTGEFLAYRILLSLSVEMKKEKALQKKLNAAEDERDVKYDFYVPCRV